MEHQASERAEAVNRPSGDTVVRAPGGIIAAMYAKRPRRPALAGSTFVICVSLLAAVFAVLPACSDDGASPQTPDSGTAPDSRTPDAPGAGGAALSGTVKDKAGVVVSGAKLEVGSASVFSDAQGRYTLAGLTSGPGTLKVTRDWFKPLEQAVTIGAASTTLDLVIEEMPLQVQAADRTLADSYNTTFDWTKQDLSITVVARPTRREFDNAVFFHNPALYRDTSAMPALAPMPAPEIPAASMARNFSFPLRAGPSQGQEVLELASIADSLAGTTLGAQEPPSFMMWTPMVNWLSEWDAAKAADLRLVVTAVRQQNWGGDAGRPQDIEKVYVDPDGTGLWVKVVFASFVQLGAGINDDDGDGLKEIYAKIAAARVPAGVVDKLRGEYSTTLFNTHGLSKEVAKSLNELYSTTAAQLERYIGQPFEVPGVGTIMYPFVVLRHAGGEKNVILVAPGP
jgi:hypothetical protein